MDANKEASAGIVLPPSDAVLIRKDGAVGRRESALLRRLELVEVMESSALSIERPLILTRCVSWDVVLDHITAC